MIDQERQIRFLYPPFFLMASILWGLYLDPNRRLSDLVPTTTPLNTNELIGLIAGGSVIIVASGFLIGAASILSLRLIFFVFGRRHYEVGVSARGLNRIWKQLHTKEPYRTQDALFTIATFDHEILPKSIHDWVARRWSAFNISAHSCTALILAPIIGSRLSIAVGTEWLVTTAIIWAILALNAIFAWRDTMGMIEFQTYGVLSKSQGEQE